MKKKLRKLCKAIKRFQKTINSNVMSCFYGKDLVLNRAVTRDSGIFVFCFVR